MDTAIRFLHSLPNWLTFVLITCSLCIGNVVAPMIRQRLFPVEKTVSDAAMDGVKTIATFMVLILAFSLNLVMGQHRQVEEVVQREASQINQLDRRLLRAGLPEIAALRSQLTDYARSVVADEWPTMSEGERSERTYQLYVRLGRSIRNMQVPEAYQGRLNEVFASLEQLSDTRDMRLMSSRLALPNLFWATVVGGCLMMFVISAMTSLSWNSALLKLAMAGCVGMLMSLVTVIDRPFSGETRVSPTAIERIIARTQTRQ